MGKLPQARLHGGNESHPLAYMKKTTMLGLAVGAGLVSQGCKFRGLRMIGSGQYRNLLRKTNGLKLLLAGILAVALAGMAADDKIQPAGSGDTKRRLDLPEVELRG